MGGCAHSRKGNRNDGISVQCLIDSLPYPFILEFFVGRIQDNPFESRTGFVDNSKGLFVLGFFHFIEWEPVDHVHLSAFQIDQSNVPIGHDLINKSICFGRILLPIILVFNQDDTIAFRPFFKSIRARPHRMIQELVFIFLHGSGRTHHACTVCEIGQQRCIRNIQIQFDGVGINHFYGSDSFQFIPSVGLFLFIPFQIELYCLRIELCSIMEFDSLPQMESVFFPIRADFPLFGQHGNDIPLAVKIHQFIKDRLEDHAVNKGCRHHRV